MKNNKFIIVLLVLIAIFTVSCQDLAVENTMRPNSTIALSNPQDVEKIVARPFRGFLFMTLGGATWGSSMVIESVADNFTVGAANMGLLDYRFEPRSIPWQNGDNDPYAGTVSDFWSRAYTVLSYSLDVFQATNNGVKIIDNDNNDVTQRGLAFNYFIHGITHGYLSLLYDEAWILPPGIDLEKFEKTKFYPHNTVMDSAIGWINKAISIAEKNQFTFPTNVDQYFFTDLAINQTDFIKICNGYIARLLFAKARTPQERNALDWNKIKNHAEKALDKDLPLKYHASSPFRAHGVVHYEISGKGTASSYRVSLRLLGIADTTNNGNRYIEYLAKPAITRTWFQINTPDRRVTGLKGGVADSKTNGTYIKFTTKNSYPSERGDAFSSEYMVRRFDHLTSGGWVASIPHFTVAEKDLMLAEALYRLGDKNAAAVLVNKTRVANGKLKPTSGDDKKLFEKLQYEYLIETIGTTCWQGFFAKRGWGLLIEGTPYQLTVPGIDLTLLGLPYKQVGGIGGLYAAPKEQNIIMGEYFNKIQK